MRPEYPRSLHESRKLFADEAAGREYLARSRWPESFRCPRCEHGEAHRRLSSHVMMDVYGWTPQPGHEAR
jgi:hypothetical protein